MKLRAVLALAFTVASPLLLSARTARADDGAVDPARAAVRSSIWSRARRPDLAKNDELLDQVDVHLRKSGDRKEFVMDGVRDLYLREALRLLETAGGERSTDLRVRLKYASVLRGLDDSAGCVRAFNGVLAAHPPPPEAADANASLAICYAKLGRRADEIRAYDAALALEANGGNRARLLANRGEAEMATGNLEAAIAGYRDAIGSVTSPFDIGHLATTYWGLGVALDRSGNLDAGLGSIAIARGYDRADVDISGPDWFYSPSWDEAWYQALGHWQHARTAKLASVRTEHYLTAVALWQEYLARAPADDLYAPLARVRLKQCEHERDAALNRSPAPKASGTSRVPRPATH